jgi:integrase
MINPKVRYKSHKIKQVKAKPNNTSIVVYYSHQKKERKIATGVSISNKKNAKGEYVDWDYKLNMIKPTVENFLEKKKKIEELGAKCNAIILDYFNKNRELTVEAFDFELMRELVLPNIINDNAPLVTFFFQFHEEKKKHFEAGGSIISLKDYTSTLNLLIDYQKCEPHPILVKDLNVTLFRALHTFMRVEHIDKEDQGITFITKGKMNPKTCKKRFDILIQFAEYIKETKLIDQYVVDELKKYRRLNVRVPKTDKITMEIDEIYSIYDFEFENPKHRQIVDVFVFLCLTGIRYQDYLKFDKRYIKWNPHGLPVYERMATKTRNSSGINYRVPLCDTAMEILWKYDFKVPIVSKPNVLIKEALQLTGLFDDVTNIVNGKTGVEKLRFQAISMHKSRDIFITNLVDITPLNTLMKYTGHSKLSTLQGYIDTKRSVETRFIEQAFVRKNEKSSTGVSK